MIFVTITIILTCSISKFFDNITIIWIMFSLVTLFDPVDSTDRMTSDVAQS